MDLSMVGVGGYQETRGDVVFVDSKRAGVIHTHIITHTHTHIYIYMHIYTHTYQ